MASIFTYDPDPPRVSSPWATPRASTPRNLSTSEGHALSTNTLVNYSQFTETRVTKLEAEPQEGPTEYKLHLLLRPRRSFTSTSTGRHVPGSHRPRPDAAVAGVTTTRGILDSLPTVAHHQPADGASLAASAAVTSSQSRQQRLEQLTTQLLWRLQQSSPYHSSASNVLILPQLPEASPALLKASGKPSKLLPGLEESRGALYEIGVSDDGTLIGLAEDELDESLSNLRAMAASLGCSVEVTRRHSVGHCEWIETLSSNGKNLQTVRTGKLWVAEAFVKPDLDSITPRNEQQPPMHNLADVMASPSEAGAIPPGHSLQEQLRVSLTGAAHSGKSSLLGSLSTATLDNGRGKSRLSLLKHRHEIETGRTSSVAQELIGYRDPMDNPGAAEPTQVINYASDNVSVWTDIHGLAESGRLVFLSDSPGEPRYRRTTVRGLVGWAPHWTLLCIPADNTDDTSGKVGSTPSLQETLGSDATETNLSQAHLELCLNLELPLVIIITKLDLASKSGLRQTLSKILSTLKSVGRKPSIIPDSGTAATETDLRYIPANVLEDAKRTSKNLVEDPLNTVPILLTSAVKGAGIQKLHALLRALPFPASATSNDLYPPESHATKHPLFHIEDVYSNSLSTPTSTSQTAALGSIIGGHLRYGSLRIGDQILVGPYPTDLTVAEEQGHSEGASPSRKATGSNLSLPTSRSFPGALHKSMASAALVGCSRPSSQSEYEWRQVRIVSLRNLRLPVMTLHTGQVGTIGIEPLPSGQDGATSTLMRLRKGMVLVGSDQPLPLPKRSFTARFKSAQANAVRGLSIGTLVVVYTASVRSTAKLVAAATDEMEYAVPSSPPQDHVAAVDDDADGFGFNFDAEEAQDDLSESLADSQFWGKPDSNILVTFQFVASKEFIEAGSKVFIMPGGGVAGLEGYAGRIINDESSVASQRMDAWPI